MEVQPTRGKRTRRRRARRRVALMACGLAVMSVSLAAAGVAQPETAVGGASFAESSPSLQGWGKPAQPVSDVGIWAVEGSQSIKTMTRLEGTSAVDSEGLTRRSIQSLSVVIRGKAHDVLTNAITVGQLLSAMRIEPDGDDVVVPSSRTPLQTTSRVVYAPVAIRTISRVEPVTVGPAVVTTDRLHAGTSEVLRSGRVGQVLRTYRVRYVNGKVFSRRLVFSRVVRPPLHGRRLVGTARSSRVGEASWYIIPASWEGLCTTCPDTELTAASPWIPFGTRVKVVNLSTGAMVTVVINDRGPFGGRLIDLSEAAFSHIAPLGQGVAQVRITW